MPDPIRRLLLAGGAALACLGAAPTEQLSRDSADLAWDYVFPSISGGLVPLGEYRGDVLLVATASCGFAPQYQALQDRFGRRGLQVIGVPSDDPGGASADAKGCAARAADRVSFPIAIVSHLRGPEAQPFYTWVRRVRGWEPDGTPNAVLIGRDGRVAATFGPQDAPDGPALPGAIAAALAAPPS